MRTPLIAGNWKMNLSAAGCRALAEALRDGAEAGPAELAVCPPFVYLPHVLEVVRGSRLSVGAQNVFHERAGAFTGEIAAGMLAELGVRYVIVGHSERRHTIGHHEDDRMINLKVRAALAAGLTPILCVGETLGERQAGQTLDVLTYQLTAGLVNVSVKLAGELVIAYEPVWAIGTGQNATAAQAQEAHAHIRAELGGLLGPAVAQSVRILYGGSMKPENAAELIGQPDVDGGLVGGASLKAESFLGIAAAATSAKGGR